MFLAWGRLWEHQLWSFEPALEIACCQKSTVRAPVVVFRHRDFFISYMIGCAYTYMRICGRMTSDNFCTRKVKIRLRFEYRFFRQTLSVGKTGFSFWRFLRNFLLRRILAPRHHFTLKSLFALAHTKCQHHNYLHRWNRKG